MNALAGGVLEENSSLALRVLRAKPPVSGSTETTQTCEAIDNWPLAKECDGASGD